MTPTHSGILPLSPLLSNKAQSAFVLDDLKTGTLVSLSQLCDDDCIAIFSRFKVQILKQDKIIITGKRMSNGLWSIPLQIPPQHQVNGILRLDQTKQELAIYHHATLGSPVPSTLLRAIRRGHLITFPGLTTTLISKHLPKSLATVLGHQDQEAKNIRSTTTFQFDNTTDLDADLAPALATRTHQISAMLLSNQTILKSYSDQTGRFPVPSSRGNHYIFVLYHQDTNSIHAVAIPNRKAASIRDGNPPTRHLLSYTSLITNALKLSRMHSKNITSTSNESLLKNIVSMQPNVQSEHSRIISSLFSAPWTLSTLLQNGIVFSPKLS